MTEEPAFVTCGCCGYKTIYEEHDICDVCFWQCDWAQETHPDWHFGANGRLSLREAQQNFMRFGSCNADPDHGLESPSLYERDPEWRPLPAEPDPVEDATAWHRVIPPPEPAGCPCCGYRTILEEGDQCRICGWKFEGGYTFAPDKHHPELNDGLSLREAQQNYRQFGAFSETYSDRKKAPGPDDLRDPYWQAFPPLEPGEG